MTTASKITLARVALIPVFMLLLLLGFNWIALIVFAVASLTDFVDGYIARHYNQVSDFGKFLDPLADKLLVTAAMAREFAVSGLRMVAATGGKVLAAGWSGKIKTFATMLGLCIMMAFSATWLDWTVTVVIAVTTLYSGIEYFVENWNVIKP